MERVELIEGLEFSRLVYGMWRLGDDDDVSPTHIQSKIEACLAQGITTMDQADIYGGYEAEALFGACLAQASDLRDKLEIVTKCDIVAPIGRYKTARVKYYDTSAAHIQASVDQSLRLMRIEHIDLLLIHRPDPFMDHQKTGAALDGLIASGKIRAAGVSNFRPWDFSLLQSAMTNPLVTNQIEMSVLAHQAFTNGDLAFLQEHDLPVMAWSPLGGGALFGADNTNLTTIMAKMADVQSVDIAAIAIAWLLAHPANILPVMGSNKLHRIARFSDAFKVKMDREDWFEIYSAALGHEVA